MLQIIITDKDNKGYIKAYEIHATNIEIKDLAEMIRCMDGQAHYIEVGHQEINLIVGKEPVAIELDEQIMKRVAVYNLDRNNQTLVKEIEFHESKLSDLKQEVERFNKILDSVKEIAKDMVDGAEYERVTDYEDYE